MAATASAPPKTMLRIRIDEGGFLSDLIVVMTVVITRGSVFSPFNPSETRFSVRDSASAREFALFAP